VPNAVGIGGVTSQSDTSTIVTKSTQAGAFVRAVHDRLAAHFHV